MSRLALTAGILLGLVTAASLIVYAASAVAVVGALTAGLIGGAG